jgi:hypothetical protein
MTNKKNYWDEEKFKASSDGHLSQLRCPELGNQHVILNAVLMSSPILTM